MADAEQRKLGVRLLERTSRRVAQVDSGRRTRYLSFHTLRVWMGRATIGQCSDLNTLLRRPG